MLRNLSGLALAVLAWFLAGPAAGATDYTVQHGLDVVARDGGKVTAELYLPAGSALHPVLIAAHGGDWKYASSALYRHWGPYLARHGYALLALDYRLIQGDRNRYPGAVEDMRAALRLVREHGAEHGLDAQGIGLIGDSAGAQVAALAALTDPPERSKENRIKALIGIYGIYDLAAQWRDDQLHRPDDDIVGRYLGTAPSSNPALYDEASPIRQVHATAGAPAVLLVWGTRDERVDSAAQSAAFLSVLQGAGYTALGLAIAGAPHYWVADPIRPGKNTAGYLAPRLLAFLRMHLPLQ